MAIKENVNINTKTSEKRGISKFFRELKAEVKRITWPSKDDTKKALIAVGVVVLIYIILTRTGVKNAKRISNPISVHFR